MDIESEVYYKDDDGDIIGANVLIYNDTEDIVEKIVIVEEKCLQSLKDTLNNLDNTYLQKEELIKILTNEKEDTEINATHLNNLNSADFALRKHTHDEYATKNHSSNKPEYGLSSTSEYGHCRVRNDLTAPTYINGEALSAYQGQVIGKRLTEVESTSNNVYENYTKNSMQIKIGRWSDNAGEDNTELKLNYKSDGVYAKIYCDNPLFDYSNREVIIIVNNIPYKRTTDKKGKTNQLSINLEKGTYVVQTFIKGYDGMNSANTMKLVTVV